jgi:hypothetical protein
MIPVTLGNVLLKIEDSVTVTSSAPEGNEENTHAQESGHLASNINRRWLVRARALICRTSNIGFPDSFHWPHHPFRQVDLHVSFQHENRTRNRRAVKLHRILHIAIVELCTLQMLVIDVVETVGANIAEQIQALPVALEVPDQIVLGVETLQTRSTCPEPVVQGGILIADMQFSMSLPGV